MLPSQNRDEHVLHVEKNTAFMMTGSAGTAMDVLVTCFNKMGGGSGRRGCKY